MRRPLFTTGLPQVPAAMANILATPNAALSILDLRDLSVELQSYTRFVTLYAMNQDPSGSDTLAIAWREGTATPISIAVAALPTGISAPVKVLDRFPLRGDAELIASNGVGAVVVVWGYFELDGTAGVNPTDRPLLPGSLVSPFTYEPAFASGNADTAQIHLFDTGYFDTIVLDAIVTGDIEGGINKLVVNDGVSSQDISLNDDGSGIGLTPVRIFDGIPMMAGGATGTPGISSATVTGGLISAWGSFTRVS